MSSNNTNESKPKIDPEVLQESGVDFSDLDNLPPPKAKDEVKDEVTKKTKSEEANDALAAALTSDTKPEVENENATQGARVKREKKLAEIAIEDEIVKEEVKEEKTKAEKQPETPPKVITEDDMINQKAETPIVSESDEDEITKDLEEIQNLMNKVPKTSVRHVDIKAVEEGKESSDHDIVIDTEDKEKIVSKTEDENKIEKETEEIRQRLEQKTNKIAGFTVYGGDVEGSNQSSVSSINPTLSKLETMKFDPDKIVGTKKVADTKANFLSQYINPEGNKVSPVTGHRVVRFPLLLSGYYAEMFDYSYGELASVTRIVNDPDTKFAVKLRTELVSLFQHISWTTLKPDEQLSFDEWVEKTYWPDLEQFYFGAYDATYPGESTYNIVCGRCRQTTPVTKSNKQLCYILQNVNDPILNDKFLKDVLMEKRPVEDLRLTKVYSKANTVYDKKVIYPQNIKVTYAVPTILDILEWLEAFEGILTEDEGFKDYDSLIDPSDDNYNILLLYTHIKMLTVPVISGKNENGQDIIRFFDIDARDPEGFDKRVENKRYILQVLRKLPNDKFAELFEGREVAEKVRLKGIQHILHNCECSNPECKQKISQVSLDMRVNFFERSIETLRRIMQL